MKEFSAVWGRATLLSVLVLGLMLSITAVPRAQDASLQPKVVGAPLIPQPGSAGGTLTLGLNNSPGTFHPYRNFAPVPQIAFSALLETNPVTLQYEPALASDFDVSSDDRRVTVMLRDGVRWSDGELIDVHDIEFTWVTVLQDVEFVQSLNNGGAGIFLPDYTFSIIDAQTVEFELTDTRASLFVGNLTGFPLLPEHVLSGLSAVDFANAYGITSAPGEIIGAGPFRFASITLDESGESTVVTQVVLERNPHYFKVDTTFHPLPYFDEVVVTLFPDDGGVLNGRLESGEIDLSGGFGAQSAVDLEALSGVQVVQAQETVGVSSIMFNEDIADPDLQSLFRDDAFRLAIAQSFDRADLLAIQPDVSQYLSLTESFVHPDSPFFDAGSNPQIPRDLAHANALLDSIGIVDTDGDGLREFADGDSVSFVFNVNDNNSTRVTAGERLTEIWRNELGLDVEFLAEPFPNLQARFDFGNRTADFEVMLVAFGIGFTTIQDTSYLNCQWASSGICHVHRFSDPEGATERQLRIDEIFSEVIAQGLSLTERLSLERELQQLISEDRGQIPMWRNRINTALREDIQNGQSIGLPGQGASLEFLWRE